MLVESLVVGPFQTNAYIVYGAPGGEAAVIDPGGDPEEIVAALKRSRLTVTHILNTHGHGDHIAANADIKALFPEALICVHPRDSHMLTNAAANLSAAFGFAMTSPPPDLLLEGNGFVEAAGINFRVEHLPGHSPGSICFVPECEEPVVFSGDTLFAGSIGRTDFPGGNTGLLLRGIREVLLTMPEETVVYSGHGVKTTIGTEKVHNPFVGESAAF